MSSILIRLRLDEMCLIKYGMYNGQLSSAEPNFEIQYLVQSTWSREWWLYATSWNLDNYLSEIQNGVHYKLFKRGLKKENYHYFVYLSDYSCVPEFLDLKMFT